MTISRDDVRRELRGIDADNATAMRPWQETLYRVFGSRSDLSTNDKAQLLGVPGRRQFFKIGGATLLGAAVLAACGDDDDTSTASSSSGSAAASSAASGGPSDIVLLKTASSLEALAVATYKAGISSGLVTTPAVGDAAKLFRDHHQAHLDALVKATEEAGETGVTKPNEAVKKMVVDPAVAKAKTEADILMLARDLELAAAQTYVFAATQLDTPAYRSTIMTIGGVESRHAIVLQTVLKDSLDKQFPAAFYSAENPLPATAVIK